MMHKYHIGVNGTYINYETSASNVKTAIDRVMKAYRRDYPKVFRRLFEPKPGEERKVTFFVKKVKA